MLACSTLGRLAVSGDGVRAEDGTVDSSILVHPQLSPDQLRRAADELYDEELFVDLSLENDPTTSRAHATLARRRRSPRRTAPRSRSGPGCCCRTLRLPGRAACASTHS